MRPVRPKPLFRYLSRDAVLHALDDLGCSVEAEVMRLVDAYGSYFWQFGLGAEDIEYLAMKARWPIEEVALELTAEGMRK